jgi:inner membrane protein
MRGVKEPIVANLNGAETIMNPGPACKDILRSGVGVPTALDEETKKYSFKFVVKLNGSDRINFVPVGKSTTVSLSSKWPSPSFAGEYLPTKRSLSDKGFTAEWKVLDLNRDYPQQWAGQTYRKHAERSAFGVGLFTPADHYQKTLRTSKYAILFVILIFIAFFISELTAGVRLHPVQYLLIGSAIITFYVLLISFSEHIRFGTAYLI